MESIPFVDWELTTYAEQNRRLEGTVMDISTLLVQFTELLEEQSESVIDVHRQSKVTTQHVQEVIQLLKSIARCLNCIPHVRECCLARVLSFAE